MERRLLPVGTIVKVKDRNAIYMIVGYLRFKGEKDNYKVYDYSAVLFPFGYMSEKEKLSFNHEDIEEIIHLQPTDEEVDKVLDSLSNVSEEEIRKMIDEQFETQEQ